MENEERIDTFVHGRVEPHIYAFRTTDIPPYTKVGDTYRSVDVRIDEWRKKYNNISIILKKSALVDSNTFFRDYAVHDFLCNNGFHRLQENEVPNQLHYSKEFFKDKEEQTVKDAVNDAIKDIKDKHGIPNSPYTYYDTTERLPEAPPEYLRDAIWEPRDNQKTVIENFYKAYMDKRHNLLMYAVMRFGKTFTALCCAKKMDAELVVVVSGKTSVKEEWKENVQRPLLFEGYKFVCADDLIRNNNIITQHINNKQKVVVFLTLQDLLRDKVKHKDLYKYNDARKIDLLIIDESHFAARSEQTGRILAEGKRLKRSENKGYDEDLNTLTENTRVFKPKVKLHLSGTPYRILLTQEFQDEDIIAKVQYNDIYEAQQQWYADNMNKNEEDMKEEWENPYYGFPQMIRFAFNLNESAKAKLNELSKQGVNYKLNDLFTTESLTVDKENCKHKKFKNYKEIVDLLSAIDGCKKDENIFSFLDYDKIQQGEMCHHIVMVLPWRASCDAMEKLLREEKFDHLNEYEILNISGFECPQNFSDNEYSANVKSFISKCENEGKKTITLTVGKMLTGSTVKEWDTMIYLKDTSSPQEYDQATYRLQSQYLRKIYTSKEGDNKKDFIIRDMKPQTLLVDFDPTRMFVMQNERTLIGNVIDGKKGNDKLAEQLERDLRISPIIIVNKNKIEQVYPQDIIKEIRKYNSSRSVLDETFDIFLDDNLFADEELKQLIEQQPEMNDSGSVFSMEPHKSKKEGADIDTNNDNDSNKNKKGTKNATTNNQEDDAKVLRKKLQTYYFKILLFAYLSDLEEKSLADVIQHIENDFDCYRIAENIELDIDGLKKILQKIDHRCLQTLDNKINNVDDLSGDSNAKIQTALRKFSRLAKNIITTPEDVAKNMVNMLPADVTANSRFFNIAGKTGEFEYALCQKYGDKVKKNIYTLPINGVTYECTLKIFKLLEIPTENIITEYYSYDLINKNKEIEYLKKLKDMNFDVIIGNPPYQEMNGGGGGSSDALYNKFVEFSKKIDPNYMSFIIPARWTVGGRYLDNFRSEMIKDKRITKFYDYFEPKDIFPQVDIEGGICYFLRGKEPGLCYIQTKWGDGTVHNSRRYLEHKFKIDEKETALDIFVRDEHAISIIEKVLKSENFTPFSTLVKPRNYYKLDSMPKKATDVVNNIGIWGLDNKKKRVLKYIEEYKKPNDTFDMNMLSKWKVFISKADGAAGQLCYPVPARIIGETMRGGKNVICTITFLVIGPFETEIEAENVQKFMKTKFFRFLLGIRKLKNVYWKNFSFIPCLDFTQEWNDSSLYEKFNLSDKERQHIDATISSMD